MQGIIAAVPTPLGNDRKPLKQPFLEQCRWVLNNGGDGLNILGSTGEANSMWNADRLEVMGWAAENLDNARLMVGTGTPSLDETIELTRHADDVGYPVALVLPPYYYKQASDAGLIAWYQAVHAALGDRKIRIYFYNYPQMTGINLSVDVISSLAAKFSERFAGIKDSSGDLDYCRQILAACPEMAVFPSSETSLNEAHASGFAGCISATVNITAPLCAEVWEARQGDMVPETIKEIARIRNVIAEAGLIPAIKHLVARRTGNPVWDNVIAPLMPIDPQTSNRLDRDVLEGFAGRVGTLAGTD